MNVAELVAKLANVPGSFPVHVDADWGNADVHPMLTGRDSVLFTPYRPKGLIEL